MIQVFYTNKCHSQFKNWSHLVFSTHNIIPNVILPQQNLLATTMVEMPVGYCQPLPSTGAHTFYLLLDQLYHDPGYSAKFGCWSLPVPLQNNIIRSQLITLVNTFPVLQLTPNRLHRKGTQAYETNTADE